jgi:hypothetical protein
MVIFLLLVVCLIICVVVVLFSSFNTILKTISVLLQSRFRLVFFKGCSIFVRIF